jgi:hypothetical protein
MRHVVRMVMFPAKDAHHHNRNFRAFTSTSTNQKQDQGYLKQ